METLKKILGIALCLFYITALKVGRAEEIQTTERPVQDIIVIEQADTAQPDYTELGTYTITGYCACEKCCGEWAKNRPAGAVYGAEGTALISEVSVANNNFTFGTHLFIDGWGEVVVQDRTAKWVNEKYNGKILDIYFDSHEQAVAFAKREMKVGIIE